jgi:GNAT superfamily N-acetyltransferase
MQISVRTVENRKDLRRFIRFPLDLYRGDPYFVAPLLLERKQFFDPGRNPLFQFTDVQYFLAFDERGKLVGRVTAHVNHRHNDYWKEKAGCFGFFECVQRPEVAAVLMEAVERWLRERGMTVVRGPFNFSTNEDCGFLAEGFDDSPAIMMTYNPRYYLEFVERLGYTKAKDLWAFDYGYQGAIPEYLIKFGRRVEERTGVTIRTLDPKNLNVDVEKALRVYNSAWARNWGFVPMTDEQFRHMAAELKPVLDPAVALIAEKDGEPVGFMLSLPDYNILLKKLNGRLLPFGWLRLLLGRRSIHRVRVLTGGVIENFRNRGIDVLLYRDTFRNGLARGYFGCEMSWILEDNVLMIRAMERMGARHYKTYRIYEKAL